MNDLSELRGKKFIASYSGGKDSVLAIYRAVNAGLVPLGLITTYNTAEGRSWFHGMTTDVLSRASDSLAMPLTLIETTGERYEDSFEKALSDLKSKGAQVCVFGDIDIEGHLEWCTARCERADIIPCFPLWKEDRKKVVFEFIDAGFSAIIKIVDTARLPDRLLGRTLNRETADEMMKSGADICGENGEYHTFVFDGPLFSDKVRFAVKEEHRRDGYAVLNIE